MYSFPGELPTCLENEQHVDHNYENSDDTSDYFEPMKLKPDPSLDDLYEDVPDRVYAVLHAPVAKQNET